MNINPLYRPASNRWIHKLNQRQRKKYRLCEFAKLSFALEVDLYAGIGVTEYEEFVDSFIAFIESIGLLLSLTAEFPIEAAVWGEVFGNRIVTPEDRVAVDNWLTSRSEVDFCTLHKIEDIYRYE